MTEVFTAPIALIHKSKKRRERKKKAKERIRLEIEIIKQEPSADDEIVYPTSLDDIPTFELKGNFERFRNIDKDDLKNDGKDDNGANKSNKSLNSTQSLNELPMKARAAAILQDDHERDGENDEPKIGKKQLKRLNRMTTAQLKISVDQPELVETWDYCSRDPILLLELKSMRNTVPVPRHWCAKRKYLQGKRGFEKPAFKLPEFIARTGITEMRQTAQDRDSDKSLKTKMREKIRPKVGHVDIDYNKLHDAFFKDQVKPPLTIHGDIYYEGKEFEVKLKEKKPGQLSDELRTALGLPTGPNADKYPPPWLIAMQRYGPPPSYPNLKIPGLNAPIPYGCSFGYHANGWGKPPVDETGRPIYGEVFLDNLPIPPPPSDDDLDGEEGSKFWGEIESDDEESDNDENGPGGDSRSDAEDDDDDDGAGDASGDRRHAGLDADRGVGLVGIDRGGLFTPAEGLVTPSGVSSVGLGLATPQSIELRKKAAVLESSGEGNAAATGEQKPLFTVLHQVKAEIGSSTIMGSEKLYQMPSDLMTPADVKAAKKRSAPTPSGTVSGHKSSASSANQTSESTEPKSKKHKDFKF